MLRQRLSLFVLLFVLGCQWSENRYLQRRVSDTELIGRWTITPTGIEGLATLGVDARDASSHFVVLRPDHRCEIRAFENFMKPDRGRTIETSCMWRLREDGERQQIEIESRKDSGRWFFYLAEENGRLLLWNYTTDPDQWDYYEFAR